MSTIFLQFDVIAPNLMPHPRARLLEHGLVKKGNLIHGGQLENGINQTIGFFGRSLQLHLDFRSNENFPPGASMLQGIMSNVKNNKG